MSSEKKYSYDVVKDIYTVELKKAQKTINISGDKHRSMQIAYCGPENKSVDEICAKHEFPKVYFEEYKTAFVWTRGGIILTDEQLGEHTVDECVENILSSKRYKVQEEADKKQWEKTKKDAEKWEELIEGKVNPFLKFIESWIPPKREPVKEKKESNKSGRWLVLVCSDWQIGLSAEGRYLFRQKDWNTSKAKKALLSMIDKIINDIKTSSQPFEGIYILLAGDLNHGLKGKTEKGTPLQCDVTRDEQVDSTLSALCLLIEQFSSTFDKVMVKAVRGNHDGTDFYPIALALKNYFKQDKNIKFDITSKRTMMFKINKTLVILDHGASDIYSSHVPKSGKPRESYIQSLMLSNPKALQGINQCLFIQGDKHHFEHVEYNDFEFIMVGALPKGDQFSDNLNLNSRPRQNCFIIDKSGLKATFHYYIE